MSTRAIESRTFFLIKSHWINFLSCYFNLGTQIITFAEIALRFWKNFNIESVSFERGKVKVDIHTHSIYSYDGLDPPGLMMKYAKRRGLDAIAIVDHDTHRGWIEGKKIQKDFFFRGIEISSRDGEILALGIDETIEVGLSAEETIEKVKDLGGITIAPHPYTSFFREGVGDLVKELDFGAIEVFNGGDPFNYANRKAEETCRKLEKPVVAGSDAHTAEMLGFTYIEAEVDTEEELWERILNDDFELNCDLIPVYGTVKLLGRRFILNPFFWTYYIRKNLPRRARVSRRCDASFGLIINGTRFSPAPKFLK